MAKRKTKLIVKKGDTPFDKIKAYYIDPVKHELSDKLEEVRQRYTMYISLRHQSWTRPMIVGYWEDEYGLKARMAYIDFKNAEELYGKILKADKEAERAHWIEICHDFRRRCLEARDLESEAKAIKMLAQYGALSEDDLSFNPEKLENPDLEIGLPKDQIEMIKALINKGSVDMNKLSVIDVDFEDVK